MIDVIIDALTVLRVSELEEGDEHPADLPREELVDRLIMTDALARGERGKRRAEDINTIVEARARLAFASGAEQVLGSANGPGQCQEPGAVTESRTVCSILKKGSTE